MSAEPPVPPSDAPPSVPAATPPSLREQVELTFAKLRRTDRIVRVHEREIARTVLDIQDAQNRATGARNGIRSREHGLMKEAFLLVSRKAGVKRIPGARTPRENAAEYLLAIKRKLKAAEDAANES